MVKSPVLEFGVLLRRRAWKPRMKNKFLRGGGKAPVRPRRQGRLGVAFTGAQRKPLTKGADGSGAGFSQEGIWREVRYVPRSGDTGVKSFGRLCNRRNNLVSCKVDHVGLVCCEVRRNQVMVVRINRQVIESFP